MISIVNYGMGNLGSIQNMLKKLNIQSQIISSPEECQDVQKLILPGVGHFEEGMRVLTENGWLPILNQKVIVEQIPVLGICLGMQLMAKSSEEGSCNGLNWIDANVKRFKFEEQSMKVPHMGWNEVLPKCSSPLFEDFDKLEDIRFYHVHSYYVELNNPEFEIAKTVYGIPFTSGFQKNNVYGVQFHPEKSHKFGLKMLSNFAKI
ncbi:imidazole glycerol phosphate synthase subunit HisH [Flavobacterium sp. SOK18b]|uniref:imidazole glycerol phosphate synthase subunit HisH n=1 Tax=Flavobacterium sp. SOK18b TaxID=797900 RepID=UPI0015F920E0|nr:imidazole glycerol phosphate synthase subunit HisH [Flavobacterium sp. SOK18b]MBB1193875.1 imidazole glycerol phosphate synthase subunit HisH [Flavobacterium sp. SOK18b]